MTEFEPRTSGIRSYRSTNWATTTAHKDELYGPDLVKFHHFDQYLKIFGNIFKVYLVLGKIFSSLWYNLYAFGKFVLLKMAKYWKHNLVTLMGIKTFFLFLLFILQVSTPTTRDRSSAGASQTSSTKEFFQLWNDFEGRETWTCEINSSCAFTKPCQCKLWQELKSFDNFFMEETLNGLSQITGWSLERLFRRESILFDLIFKNVPRVIFSVVSIQCP